MHKLDLCENWTARENSKSFRSFWLYFVVAMAGQCHSIVMHGGVLGCWNRSAVVLALVLSRSFGASACNGSVHTSSVSVGHVRPCPSQLFGHGLTRSVDVRSRSLCLQASLVLLQPTVCYLLMTNPSFCRCRWWSCCVGCSSHFRIQIVLLGATRGVDH